MSQIRPPKITFKFSENSLDNFEHENVQYFLKYDILFKGCMIVILIYDVKKNMTFQTVLKILRKSAYF